MSNNTNQNNYEKNHNKNHGGRKNFNNKVAKVNPNEIKAPLYLPADLNENIASEILNVLTTTKFNKISIPLGIYRNCIENNVDPDDNRICTIGYIRKFDAETEEFTVVIFSKFTDIIKGLGDIAVDLMYTTYKDALGTITKFNILPVFYETDDEEANESEEVVTNETDDEEVVFAENSCEE